MAENKDDRKLKDPAQVSGWGPDSKDQDFSDIAKKSDVNAEFDPRIGHESKAPRGAPDREDEG